MTTCPVTVILPAYNAIETIGLSLRTAAFQTLPPAEIIVLDDASTDATRDKIKETIDLIQDETPSSIVFVPFDQNSGVYRLRNEALKRSTQPYLAFLDADDYWHPQKLELQYEYFKNDPDLALACHALTCRPEGPEDLKYFKVEDGLTPRELSHRYVLLRNIIVTITVMIKKEDHLVFDENKRRGSDMLYWLETVLGGGKALWFHEELSFTAKELFGAGGLSGNIWKAEMAQQNNFVLLCERGYISKPYTLFLRGFSLAKMVRRYLIHYGRVIQYHWKKLTVRAQEDQDPQSCEVKSS